MVDRAARPYQNSGGKVLFEVAPQLPDEVRDMGLSRPGASHVGVGRVSTGLGTPHSEANPDFHGLMLAFQTAAGQRVNPLGINHPATPTDNHRDFMSVLHATAKSAVFATGRTRTELESEFHRRRAAKDAPGHVDRAL